MKGKRMFANFRMVSSGQGWFTVDWTKTVRPENLDKELPAMLQDQRDYQSAEPRMGWRLQTRGENRDWHDWEDTE